MNFPWFSQHPLSHTSSWLSDWLLVDKLSTGTAVLLRNTILREVLNAEPLTSYSPSSCYWRTNIIHRILFSGPVILDQLFVVMKTVWKPVTVSGFWKVIGIWRPKSFVFLRVWEWTQQVSDLMWPRSARRFYHPVLALEPDLPQANLPLFCPHPYVHTHARTLHNCAVIAASTVRTIGAARCDAANCAL